MIKLKILKGTVKIKTNEKRNGYSDRILKKTSEIF